MDGAGGEGRGWVCVCGGGGGGGYSSLRNTRLRILSSSFSTIACETFSSALIAFSSAVSAPQSKGPSQLTHSPASAYRNFGTEVCRWKVRLQPECVAARDHHCVVAACVRVRRSRCTDGDGYLNRTVPPVHTACVGGWEAAQATISRQPVDAAVLCGV